MKKTLITKEGEFPIYSESPYSYRIIKNGRKSHFRKDSGAKRSYAVKTSYIG